MRVVIFPPLPLPSDVLVNSNIFREASSLRNVLLHRGPGVFVEAICLLEECVSRVS